jgi:ferritin-like metal-binding protein YciE
MLTDYQRLSLHTLWIIANGQMRVLNEFHETVLKAAIEQHHQHLEQLKEELDSIFQRSMEDEVAELKADGKKIMEKLERAQSYVDKLALTHGEKKS